MAAPRGFLIPSAAVVVFSTAFVVLAGGVSVGKGSDRPEFFIDEAHKIAETHFWSLFSERNWDDPLWTRDFYARTNPPVAKYIYGMALSLAGSGVGSLELQSEFEKSWRQPAVLRAKVPDDMLRTTRLVSVFFAALVASLLFIIGRATGGWVAGLAAPLLFLAHPAVHTQARRGLADTILLFFVTLIVPVTASAAARLRRHLRTGGAPVGVQQWVVAVLGVAVLPGIVVALAAGTRVNGALSALVYAAGIALTAARGGKARLTHRLGVAAASLALAGMVAVAVFIGINPSYHHAPFRRIVETAQLYQDWTLKQWVDPGQGAFTLKERLAAVGLFTLRSATTPLASFLGAPGMWLTVLGFAAGLLYLATSERSPPVVLIWISVCILGTVLSLYLVWPRYLLLAYEATCLAVAVGLGSLSAAALRYGQGAPSRPRLLAGVVCAVVLWLLASFTSVLIAPELVDPRTGLVTDSPRQYAWYAAALEGDGDRSPIVLHHRALILAVEGRLQDAKVMYQSALDRLPEPSGEGELVRRLRIRYDLALVESALGNRSAAVELLTEHAEAVRSLRDGLVSGDPKIRAHFDEIIAADEDLVRRLSGPRAEIR